MSRISEECSRCLRRVLFASEEERHKALLQAAGEFLCAKCRAEMKENA